MYHDSGCLDSAIVIVFSTIDSFDSFCPFRCSHCVMHPNKYEPPHDKTNKMTVRPAKSQISAWASAQSDQSLRCVLNG